MTSSTSYQSSLIEDCPLTHSTSTDQRYHPYIFPVGAHPLMFRLLVGIFISSLPETKHQTFWDVDVVLLFLFNLRANQCLSLSDLTLKLAMLLALISVDRSSGLVKLSLNHSQFSPNRAVLTLTELRKQDRLATKALI